MSAEERLEALKKAPPNGWVAFSEDESKVIAYGLSYDEVVAAAEEKGVNEPILAKVPQDWTAMVMTI
jgi:hypothetical protein